MLISDFKKYHINNFTYQEIINTGATLSDVQKETIIGIQKYREYVRRRVKLFFNGLTTGQHESPMHPKGMAIDTYLLPEDGPINIHIIFKGALEAGFRGIGIYWNQKIYSCHFDLRPNYAFWGGVKTANQKSWRFISLLQDPRLFKIN